MRFALLAPLLLAVLLVTPASAHECVMTTSSPEIDTGDNASGDRYYVDVDKIPCSVSVDPFGLISHHPWRAISTDCGLSVWTYQESNGVPGLQRGDEVHDGTCGRGWPCSDTLACY